MSADFNVFVDGDKGDGQDEDVQDEARQGGVVEHEDAKDVEVDHLDISCCHQCQEDKGGNEQNINIFIMLAITSDVSSVRRCWLARLVTRPRMLRPALCTLPSST